MVQGHILAKCSLIVDRWWDITNKPNKW